MVRVASVALGAALVFVTVGCGGGSEAADKLVEKAIEKSSDGKVDVDSGDGKVKITDKDGNTTEYGAGAKLPKGWPEELKPPKSVNIVAATTSTQSGKKTFFVTAESTASSEDLVKGLTQQLEAAGFEITGNTNMDTGGSGFALIEAEGKEYKASVSISEDASTGKVAIGYNLTAV